MSEITSSSSSAQGSTRLLVPKRIEAIANNPYATSLVCTIKFDSPLSTTPSLPTSEARALYDAPYSTAHIVSSILEACRPSQWTTVSSNDDLLREILRGYFTSVYVFLLFSYKDYFLHDMKRGSQRFCSPLLVNSVLAAGCDKIGWNLCIATVASALEMGLFNNSPGISHAQKMVRTMTAWALFAWQALQSYHQEKPPLVTLPPSERLPSAMDAFGDIWVKYSAANRPVPLHFSQTFVALVEFWSVLNEIASILYLLQTSKRRMTIAEASSFHLRLQEWYRRLRDHLNPYNLIFPAHFHLHHGDESYDLFTVLLAQYISLSALISRNNPRIDTYGFYREINNADVLICAYILRGQARMAYTSNAVLRILAKHPPAELHRQTSSLIGRSEEADRLAMVPPVQGEWPIYLGAMLDRDKRRLGNLFKAITETSLENEENDESSIDEVK
ncbi:hypothetical protein FANTH_6313 [Fusarium anthophilum]|uniref:Transcription factor domain-containing protein n=1 Tax=Fusarium anthophilum TaxID=48485 RepID=A0A8H4ZJS1_9HYPO|nr:hypothetical protein FANTH_6313 [Fusarium anthophilum]